MLRYVAEDSTAASCFPRGSQALFSRFILPPTSRSINPCAVAKTSPVNSRFGVAGRSPAAWHSATIAANSRNVSIAAVARLPPWVGDVRIAEEQLVACWILVPVRDEGVQRAPQVRERPSSGRAVLRERSL